MSFVQTLYKYHSEVDWELIIDLIGETFPRFYLDLQGTTDETTLYKQGLIIRISIPCSEVYTKGSSGCHTINVNAQALSLFPSATIQKLLKKIEDFEELYALIDESLLQRKFR
jgi:hypothetical protein